MHPGWMSFLSGYASGMLSMAAMVAAAVHKDFSWLGFSIPAILLFIIGARRAEKLR